MMQAIDSNLADMHATVSTLRTGAALLSPSKPSREPWGGGFAAHLRDALQEVDTRQHTAAARMRDVETGESDDLIGAMLASQDATLSFSMMTQVRNKLVVAFDDLLKTPV